MLKSFLLRLKSFRDDSRGAVAVEAVVMFPAVLWAFLALFVFFDGYRQTSLNHKAANTLADMYSRESNDVTGMYMINSYKLFKILTGDPANARMRVTVLKWSDYHDAYRVAWSRVRGDGVERLTHDSVIGWEDKLPTIPDQERIVLVETWSTFKPAFNIGMSDTDISSFVFVRLRFAPQLGIVD